MGSQASQESQKEGYSAPYLFTASKAFGLHTIGLCPPGASFNLGLNKSKLSLALSFFPWSEEGGGNRKKMSWRSGFRLIKIEFALSCNYMGGQQCISSPQWRFFGAVNLVLAFNLLKALISAEWNPNFLHRRSCSPASFPLPLFQNEAARASAVNKITSLMTFIPAQWLIQDLPLSISLMLFERGPGRGPPGRGRIHFHLCFCLHSGQF